MSTCSIFGQNKLDLNTICAFTTNSLRVNFRRFPHQHLDQYWDLYLYYVWVVGCMKRCLQLVMSRYLYFIQSIYIWLYISFCILQLPFGLCLAIFSCQDCGWLITDNFVFFLCFVFSNFFGLSCWVCAVTVKGCLI